MTALLRSEGGQLGWHGGETGEVEDALCAGGAERRISNLPAAVGRHLVQLLAEVGDAAIPVRRHLIGHRAAVRVATALVELRLELGIGHCTLLLAGPTIRSMHSAEQEMGGGRQQAAGRRPGRPGRACQAYWGYAKEPHQLVRWRRYRRRCSDKLQDWQVTEIYGSVCYYAWTGLC